MTSKGGKKEKRTRENRSVFAQRGCNSVQTRGAIVHARLRSPLSGDCLGRVVF